MALLGEVDALADDVVATVFNLCYPIAFTHLHSVAYGNGIGGAYSLDAEIALHLTVK